MRLFQSTFHVVFPFTRITIVLIWGMKKSRVSVVVDLTKVTARLQPTWGQSSCLAHHTERKTRTLPLYLVEGDPCPWGATFASLEMHLGTLQADPGLAGSGRLLASWL